MSFIGMIIIGFFVGLVARAILPGNNKMGFWLTSGLGWYTIGEPAGFVASVLGAVLIMAVLGGVRR